MRILAVGPLPPPLNGMTVMTGVALECLRERDLEIVHLDTSDHRDVGNVGRLDLRNVVLAIRHGLAGFVTVARSRPDVMYLPIAQGTLGLLRDTMFFAIARTRRIPTIVHFHGAEFAKYGGGAKPIMRRLIQWCLRDCVCGIALTESLREEAERVVAASGVVVVGNGVSSSQHLLDKQRSRIVPRVLFLSNLSPRKGYRDVLAAAQRVLACEPDVEFVIAGQWPDRKEAECGRSALRTLDLGGRVRFLPGISGLRKTQLLLSSDVFVFPPRLPEGQGLVLLEAMSAGLPVVATPMGGIRDTVVNGVTGLFVPPSNPAALADAILTLVRDERLRARLGEAGRTRYEAMFTQSGFGARLAVAIGRVGDEVSLKRGASA